MDDAAVYGRTTGAFGGVLTAWSSPLAAPVGRGSFAATGRSSCVASAHLLHVPISQALRCGQKCDRMWPSALIAIERWHREQARRRNMDLLTAWRPRTLQRELTLHGPQGSDHSMVASVSF
jgi:hypothetical protein